MTVLTREDYDDTLAALGACVSMRIPVLLWGEPGAGKTAVVESTARVGWNVETITITHSEPSDLNGLQVLVDRRVEWAPPSWALRLRDHDGPSIAFFDEFSTASPALQAAALRPLTHYQIGDLQLPATVSFIAAANPADVAAAGWELAPPTAARFVHLDWGMPSEVYCECLVSGDWPPLPVHPIPGNYALALDKWRAALSGFIRARPTQLSAIPEDAASRGRAFPTPRTWDYATRLAAFATAVDLSHQVIRLLIAGCVGEMETHEFLAYTQAQDLPDPEQVLADGWEFTLVRPDRVYVVLQSVLAAVQRHPTPRRWEHAVTVCCTAASQVGIDPAMPVIRALLRPGIRPAQAQLPPQITVFGPVLALAGLIPKE